MEAIFIIIGSVIIGFQYGVATGWAVFFITIGMAAASYPGDKK